MVTRRVVPCLSLVQGLTVTLPHLLVSLVLREGVRISVVPHVPEQRCGSLVGRRADPRTHRDSPRRHRLDISSLGCRCCPIPSPPPPTVPLWGVHSAGHVNLSAWDFTFVALLVSAGRAVGWALITFASVPLSVRRAVGRALLPHGAEGRACVCVCVRRVTNSVTTVMSRRRFLPLCLHLGLHGGNLSLRILSPPPGPPISPSLRCGPSPSSLLVFRPSLHSLTSPAQSREPAHSRLPLPLPPRHAVPGSVQEQSCPRRVAPFFPHHHPITTHVHPTTTANTVNTSSSVCDISISFLFLLLLFLRSECCPPCGARVAVEP